MRPVLPGGNSIPTNPYRRTLPDASFPNSPFGIVCYIRRSPTQSPFADTIAVRRNLPVFAESPPDFVDSPPDSPPDIFAVTGQFSATSLT
jgi:hypothetical protein